MRTLSSKAKEHAEMNEIKVALDACSTAAAHLMGQVKAEETKYHEKNDDTELPLAFHDIHVKLEKAHEGQADVDILCMHFRWFKI